MDPSNYKIHIRTHYSIFTTFRLCLWTFPTASPNQTSSISLIALANLLIYSKMMTPSPTNTTYLIVVVNLMVQTKQPLHQTFLTKQTISSTQTTFANLTFSTNQTILAKKTISSIQTILSNMTFSTNLINQTMHVNQTRILSQKIPINPTILANQTLLNPKTSSCQQR